MVKDKIFDMSVTAPAKFFKRDLIKNVKFPEGLIFEDNLFFIKMFFKARKVYFYNRYMYHRRIRKDSIMNSNFDNFSDCIVIYDLIEDHLRNIGVYDDFAESLFNRKCRDIFKRFTMVPEDLKNDFFMEIKDNFTKNKNSLQIDGTLKTCAERTLTIFQNALSSDTYHEFELSVNLFDLEMQYDKLKLQNDILKRENSKLSGQNKGYIDEINFLKSKTGFKLSNFLKR